MSASCPQLSSDPLDVRKVTVDFGTWLGTSEVLSAAWAAPAAVTISDKSVTTTEAIGYLTATVEGEYEVACTITTNDGIARKKTQRFIYVVETGC